MTKQNQIHTWVSVVCGGCSLEVELEFEAPPWGVRAAAVDAELLKRRWDWDEDKKCYMCRDHIS